MGTATAMHAITSWEEVPVFEGEASEAAFWAAHSVDIRLMQDSVVAGSESSESVTITLRMDENAIKDQAPGAFQIFELSKHDQTMVGRAYRPGDGRKRTPETVVGQG